MMLSRVDQLELLTALYAVSEDVPFQLFLDRLRRRTIAAEAFLIIRDARAIWSSHQAAPHGMAALPDIDRDMLTSLRPGRVYALEEMGQSIEGRIVRSEDTRGDRWCGVRGGGRGYSAADSALLAALLPHMAIAFDNRALLAEAATAQAAARVALERAAVDWSLLDERGGHVAGSPCPVPPWRTAAMIETLTDGAEIATAGAAIGLPPPGPGHGALVLFRTTGQPIDRPAALAADYGLTRAEARLAVALAQGASLAEAARDLGITEQTARYYSKRIYSATGTRGQGDLVRLVWTSVAALA
jgi:DNA-binding CsgD family transcriptional regulator